MTLTQDQIQDLFTFTRQHFVEWYDLQCELVDHLANDIEKIQTENPSLTFKEARDKSFKKFGVFGFMDVVEAKSKALSKRYFKMVLQEFKTFFTIPKIALTLSIITGLILLFRYFNHNIYLIYSVVISTMIYTLIVSMIFYRKTKKSQKQTGKKWLFQDFTYNGWMTINIVNLANIMLNLFDHNPSVNQNWGFTQEVIFTSVIVLVCIFIYVSTVIIPPKFVEIVGKEHPEYQLV